MEEFEFTEEREERGKRAIENDKERAMIKSERKSEENDKENDKKKVTDSSDHK